MGDGGDAKAEMKKKTKAQLAATPMEKLREAALRRGVNGIQSMGRWEHTGQFNSSKEDINPTSHDRI